MRAYLDNAATTPLDPEVLELMVPLMRDVYGNPSSIHTQGRQARSVIERARKVIAELLNASPAEIFFTSGGTEADNTIIKGSIAANAITHAITSPLEHHAVLHSLESLQKQGVIQLSFVNVNERGELDLEHLQSLLKANPRSFVSLMHANNEIGNIYDIATIGDLCETHNAIFHSDTVQTMGHFRHNLKELKVDYIVGAGHKFHGPKGVGFFYQRAGSKTRPFIDGGAQERNMRGGTENLYAIAGIAKALELAYTNMDTYHHQIVSLKKRMRDQLLAKIDDIRFNGLSGELDKSLYTVLNVSLPISSVNDMLLFSLDIAGISASGGSACASGTEIGSHVLQALDNTSERPGLRFSFGKYTTEEEIDYAVETLVDLYQKEKNS